MMNILPRYIRYRDAPAYLGVDRNRFDAEVRPFIVEIPIGDRGIAFDRLDLDAWADDYKNRNGRPSRKQGDASCEQGQRVFKSKRMEVRSSTSSTMGSASSPDLATSVKLKQKRGSGQSKAGSMSNVQKLLAMCSGKPQDGTS
jgi:hypothetical protein